MAKHTLQTHYLLTAVALTGLCVLLMFHGSGYMEEPEQTYRVIRNTNYTNSIDAVDFNTTQLNLRNFGTWSPALQKISLTKRALSDEEWQILICGGEHLININDKLSGDDAQTYAEQYTLGFTRKVLSSWSEPESLRRYGWSTIVEPDTLKNMHLNPLRPVLQHYHLRTNPTDWEVRTVRHRRAWKDAADVEHEPSKGFFTFLINKSRKRSTIIWTAMFSPDYMIQKFTVDTVEPDLKFASDIYFLAYKSWWSNQPPNPNEGPSIPPPRYIIIRAIHEGTIREYLNEIKRRKGDNSAREGGKNWPGEKYTRDDDELYVLMVSPFGQAVTWFLTAHKHVWGARTIGRIKMWASNDREEDYNMIFEIMDPPDPESEGEEAAGPDPPPGAPEEQRAVVIRQPTTLSTVARPASSLLAIAKTILHRHQIRSVLRARPRTRRADVAVDDKTWDAWLCLGRGMYGLMAAQDETAAEMIASNNGVLVNWKGKTSTQFHDPRDLARFGWKMLDEPLPDLGEVNIDDSVADSGLPVDDVDKWAQLRTEHTKLWRSEELAASEDEHEPTKAVFEGYYSAGEDGSEPALMLGLTVSPWWMINMRNIKTKTPDLQKMSDVVFLTYYEFWRKIMKHPEMQSSGGSKVPSPKFIFIKDIQEEEARDVVFPEIGRRGGFEVATDDENGSEYEVTYFGNWPGETFTPEQDEFYALLYTKQCRSIAAFLFNHKAEFGPRRIKSIRIWHSETELSYCLRLEVEESTVQIMEKSAGRRRRHDSLDPEDASFLLGAG